MYNFENTRIVFDESSGDLNYVQDKQCPRCKTSLSEVLRSGIVGCAECYRVFNKEIQAKVLQKQGTINNQGKIATKHISKIKIKEKLAELEAQKQKAAEAEDYIVAESLKNQIEKLKGDLV